MQAHRLAARVALLYPFAPCLLHSESFGHGLAAFPCRFVDPEAHRLAQAANGTGHYSLIFSTKIENLERRRDGGK
jgi:hypothetical protein